MLGFNPPPPSSTGETTRVSLIRQVEIRFNPPPPSSTGETPPKLCISDLFRSVSIRPRLRARGKRHGNPDGPIPHQFQSAPAFEHGGNANGLSVLNGASDVSIRPRLRARGKPHGAGVGRQTRKFQSAPAFEHGGNTSRTLGDSVPSVSIRPRLRARGKRGGNGGVRRRREVSIRPRLRARGKRPARCRSLRRLFQSAPAFEHGGNVFTRLACELSRACFNPPPPSSTGETISATSLAFIDRFQSAPAFEHGGNRLTESDRLRC